MKRTGLPLWRRAVAIFATGAVALLGAAGMLNAPAASAAPIDGSATGSITVHALTMPTGGAVTATGMQTTPPTGADPITGAAFKLEKSTINITTNQGYSDALALTAASFGSTDSAFGAKTGTTGSDGSFKFANLQPGVYLLTQTAAPEGKTLMAPAVVFVPMTDPSDTSRWVYDIHVYPKNGDAGKITKTDITPAGTPIAVGSTMTWQMDVPIRDIGASDSYESFKVQDLPINMKAKNVTSVVIDPAATPPTALTLSTDYTVANDSPAANQLEVTFSANGLTKINAAKGKTMRLVVTTEVLSTVTTTDGVTNAAKAIYTTTTGAGAPTEIVSDPDHPANTAFGNLKILNTNADGSQKLTGAQFQIFACDGNGTTGTALQVNGTDTFTIADADAGVIVGPLGATEGQLCLVQTKAPNEYQQLAGPQKFEFTSAKIAADSNKTVTVTVKNTATSFIAGLLPNTGGMGIALFVIVGLVLLGGAAVYMHRQRS